MNQLDPYLSDYKPAIHRRFELYLAKKIGLTAGNRLQDCANGYLYFGLHHNKDGWWFREWAPAAHAIYLIGDFSQWQKNEKFRLHPLPNGIWEGHWEDKAIHHEQYYRMIVVGENGDMDRLPTYTTRAVQDPATQVYSAQVWTPTPYKWKHTFQPRTKQDGLMIYECHIGMASEDGRVASFEEFRQQVLPRIAHLGYNCLQIMALQEHPYYGSFGYHVTNFFAVSSRFGTPEQLKQLIDDAHALGIAVVMDIVHSHASKNTREGLSQLDGTTYQFFHQGPRGYHPAWDSRCFDYGKNEVLHFLLSNCKFWQDVYHIDGFRFDGVTSMMYHSHGLGENFTDYSHYFNDNQDLDAQCYLMLANQLIHEVNKHAITIAEDMSGMPLLTTPIQQEGLGFDFRLAMGIPDFWIQYTKEVSDENWHAGHILYQMTNRRKEEHVITYAESHDQALVGDKTLIFRLADADMYWHFQHGHGNITTDRAIALHKMIRLITASTSNGGYLNFMGNEFGHPEWIDFPREGNNWSSHYARRQWSLVDNKDYYYHNLNHFDQAMIQLLKTHDRKRCLLHHPLVKLWDKDNDQVLAYRRGTYVFVYNFSPNHSYTSYGILVPEGEYEVVLNTDDIEFAGFGSTDNHIHHFTQSDPLYHKQQKGWLMLYLPARTAMVLRPIPKTTITSISVNL